MIIEGTIVTLFVVHALFFFVTGRSTWYWLSRFFFAIESAQNGLIRSVPFWYKTFLKMYKTESDYLKGINEKA